MESYWFVISCETQPNHYDIDILTFNYMPTRLMFCEIDHVGAKTYSLAEVVVATNNFKTMIGKGGFGPVYYGKLEDGKDVAIKELDVKSTQGPSEFNHNWSYNRWQLSTCHHHLCHCLLSTSKKNMANPPKPMDICK
jgi:hypothetical protein